MFPTFKCINILPEAPRRLGSCIGSVRSVAVPAAHRAVHTASGRFVNRWPTITAYSNVVAMQGHGDLLTRLYE